jgi:hypothetical protein
MSELNPFKIAQAQLAEAAEIMGLEPAVHELLRWPLREFHVTLAAFTFSMVSAFSTTRPAGRQRAASASILTRPSTPSGLWRPG